MISVQEGIKIDVYIYIYIYIYIYMTSYISMTWGDSKWITDFNRSGDLLKWCHNNRFMNLSVVIIYSIADFIIHVLSSSLRPFDGKRRVSALFESFESFKHVWCY